MNPIIVVGEESGLKHRGIAAEEKEPRKRELLGELQE
jgi:hypothetical protein